MRYAHRSLSAARPRPIRRLAALIVALLFFGSLLPVAPTWATVQAATSPFALPIFLNGSGRHTKDVAVGDLNNDGALDLVLANNNPDNDNVCSGCIPSQVFLNTGAGQFAAPTNLPLSENINASSVAVGDLNNDGALDIVLDNNVFLNTNDGTGTLHDPVGLPGSSDIYQTTKVVAGDLNNDGALDLVLAVRLTNYSETSIAFLNKNDGTGTFSDTVTLPATGPVATGDLNDDGALDLVFGNGQVYLNKNDGTGTFPADPSSSLPSSGAPAIGDLNGDGALDLVFGNGQVYLNKNDGTASFLASASLPSGGAPAIGDLNGDGALDLVFGRGSELSHVYLNKNDGTGGFEGSADLSNSGRKTSSVAIADFNGDGVLDLLLGNDDEYSQLYWNTVDQLFGEPVTLPAGGTRTIGDLNGDGALDLIFGDGQVYLNKNDGTASFLEPASLSGGKAVAIGDLNNDGALDLVFGSGSNLSQVYLNKNDGSGSFFDPYPLNCCRGTTSVGVGDLNGDGALDLVLAVDGDDSLVYLNANDRTGTFLTPTPLDSAGLERIAIVSIAVGDLNGDGSLDLVLGNDAAPSLVYLNDGAGQFGKPIELQGSDQHLSLGVAVGDLNGDARPDIILGNENFPSQIYLNNGNGQFSLPIELPGSHETWSVAAADMNGDGALDLILGNTTFASQLYLNDGTGQFGTPVDLPDNHDTYSVAAGDLNGDGALDLVLGNDSDASQIYINHQAGAARLRNNPPVVEVARPGLTQNGEFFSTPEILSDTIIPIPYTLADPEGDPVRAISATYSLDGGGSWRPAVTATPALTETSGTALRFDGMNDFVGLGNPASLNIRGRITMEAWVKPRTTTGLQNIIARGYSRSPAGEVFLRIADGKYQAGSWDGPNHRVEYTIPVSDTGTWVHLAAVYDGAAWRLYRNGVQVAAADDATGAVPVNEGWAIGARGAGTERFFNGAIDDVRIWNIARTPVQIRSHMRRTLGGDEAGLAGYWRLDDRHGAVAVDATSNHNDGTLGGGSATARPAWAQGGPTTKPHIFAWDTFASGFFGQSDNVVVRLIAYPSLRTGELYQRPYASATTFPFRVRGTQVQIVNGNQPAADALVYRLPQGQLRGALPLTDPSGESLRTDYQGYLRGRGQIAPGDRLFVLLPILVTDTYTLYDTNATPTTTSTAGYTVTNPGIQQLAVSAAHPLALFKLSVALEWDARSDAQFMSQLKFDLQRASELLYDWTNGQAALGQISIYQNREHWDDADIRVYATNRLRPNATQGGITRAEHTDPADTTIKYVRGQVRMGATWNRYGDPGGTLGEDWPRALAHELGHYLLYLDDNYLGLENVNDHLQIVPLDGCPGAMSDPYRDDYSEFHPDARWPEECAQTLSNTTTHRSDWATIATFYHWLHAPTGTISETNPGPGVLPLAVTQITTIAPTTTQGEPLQAPVFYLVDRNGSRVLPGRGARAFLYRSDPVQGEQIVDLGRPALDQVLARGARPGDRLCVYELAAQRLGCEPIAPGDPQLQLDATSGWQPEVKVTPVTSRTIDLAVPLTGTGQPAPAALQARLFASSGKSYATTLALSGGTFAGRFVIPQQEEPALSGYVQVWVDGSVPLREIVTDYSLGGGPVLTPGKVGGHVNIISRDAPAVSADGQVILYAAHQEFHTGQILTVQAATSLPAAPPWATVAGQGYWLAATENVTDFTDLSISFSYLGREVPSGEEQWLTVYYRNETSGTWQPLPTKRDPYHNIVSALTQGRGLYVLMSSIEISLYTGVNYFAYPVAESRSVRQALASIDGQYTLVRGYDALHQTWLVFDPTKADNDPTNTLKQLDFGQGYEITVTQNVTLRLRGNGVEPNVAAAAAPALYYGTLPANAVVASAAGVPLVARVGGQACGQGVAWTAGKDIRYFVAVAAHGPAAKGCGAPGRAVTLDAGGQVIGKLAWDSNRVRQVDLVGGDGQ